MNLKIHAETHPALPVHSGGDRLGRVVHLHAGKGATGFGGVLPEPASERVSPSSRHDGIRSISLLGDHWDAACALDFVPRIFIQEIVPGSKSDTPGGGVRQGECSTSRL